MIDSHCHLNDKMYEGEVDKIVENYKSNGVDFVLDIGIDMETSSLAKKQAEKYDSVYYTIGMYPDTYKKYNQQEFESFLISCLGYNGNSSHTANFDLKNGNNNNETLKTNQNNKVCNNKLLAIGEIGLDYHCGNEDKEEQIKLFESQIRLAKKYDLPIIIHNRDASGDILEILKKHAPYYRGGIIHCFSVSIEWAKEVMKLGFLISFAGCVTFKNAKNLQEVAIQIPDDKLLVETDSPYLTPVPFRGERNEPKNVVEVANFIANLRGVSYDHINKCTTENFKTLFKI